MSHRAKNDSDYSSDVEELIQIGTRFREVYFMPIYLLLCMFLRMLLSEI